MTNLTAGALSPKEAIGRVAATLRRRRSAELRFRFWGQAAIGLALGFLVLLFGAIFSNGIPGLFQHYVVLDVELNKQRLDPQGDMSVNSLYAGDAEALIREGLLAALDNPTGR